MVNLDQYFTTTTKDSYRSLFALANDAIEENAVIFDVIAETLVDDNNRNVKVVYSRLVCEIFSDGVVHLGRVIVFFALKSFIRDHFSLNLD